MTTVNMASRRRNPVLADIFSRLKYMERRGSGFRKIMSAYKGHDGYTEGMDPTFSTPWESFVWVLPKFNMDGVEGVYISSDDITDYGGQKGGQTSNITTETTTKTTTEIFRLLMKDNSKITGKDKVKAFQSVLSDSEHKKTCSINVSIKVLRTFEQYS